MPPERTRPRPATTDRGRQREHDDALGPDDTGPAFDAHVDDGSLPPVEVYESDPAAEPVPDDDADDVEVAGAWQPRVPDGRYRARYAGREARHIRGHPRLALSFHLLDGDHAGILLYAWRPVQAVGDRSRVTVGPHSALARELRTVAAQRGQYLRLDRLSTHVLQGVDLVVKTTTVRKGWDGQRIEPYSKIEAIEGVHGAGEIHGPKDPTSAERTRRWRDRRKAAAVTQPAQPSHEPAPTGTPTGTQPARDRHVTAVTPSASPDTARPQAVTVGGGSGPAYPPMEEWDGGELVPCPACRGEGESGCWCGGTGKVKAGGAA